MALIKSDRVKETSTSTGATTFALAGAGTGYRTFSSVCAIGDTFYYAISNQSNGEWEAGLGTYSALNTLTRTAVHSSSNSGNVVTFSAGTKEVFLTLTARHLDRINDNGQSTAIGSKTSVVAVNDSATLPDLDLQFSELKTLTAKYGPTPSYSRASTGTYFNASGVLTSAAVNEPRFDHVLENGVWVSKGLLIEEQRTNVWPNSLTVPTGYDGSLAPVSSSEVTAPDGTNSTLILTSIAGQRGSYYSSSATSHSVESIFFKNKSGGRYVAMHPAGGGASGVYFDIIDGLKIATFGSGIDGYIQNIGNGWFRCTVVKLSSNTSFEFSISDTYIPGSRPIGVNSVQVYAWGVQLESGSFPTSYIPTVASSVTRSADVCQITGSAFTNLWNATEGTISLEQDFLSYSDPAADQRYFSIAGSSNAPAFVLNYDNGTNFFWYRNFSGLDQLVLPDVNSAFKVALAFRTNDYATVLNGGTPVTSSTKTLPTTFAKIDIGYQVGATARSSWVQRLRYFRSRLDNTQLVNLSGGINTLAFKPVTGSGSVTVANEYSGINISVPNPLPITNGGTGAQTKLAAVTNLISNPPNDGGQYTLASKKTSGTPSFYWVDSTGYAPTLDLLFAADKSLTAYTGPTPSFSRASTGTFFNSSGVLTTAAINAPRFNHVYNGSSWVSKGLLVEEQRTNNILQSQDLTVTWTTNRGSITANATTAPDGTTTADRFVEDTANGVHGPVQFAITTTNGSASTVSGFFKAGSRSVIVIRFQDNATGSNGVGAEFNLSNGTISVAALVVGTFTSPSATITNVGGGWYRCTVTGVSTTTSCSLRVETCTTTGVLSVGNFAGSIYAGDDSSYFDSWGYQIEAGSFSTSYIPTTTAAVTRSADVCQITGGDFSGFWNASEGSVAVEFDQLADASKMTNESYIYGFQNAADAEQFILRGQSSGVYYWRSVNSGNIDATTQISSLGTSTVKHAACYKVNDFASTFNGATVVSDTSGATPIPTTLGIGFNWPSGGNRINGHIARLRYYPTRLPNATLQVLST